MGRVSGLTTGYNSALQGDYCFVSTADARCISNADVSGVGKNQMFHVVDATEPGYSVSDVSTSVSVSLDGVGICDMYTTDSHSPIVGTTDSSWVGTARVAEASHRPGSFPVNVAVGTEVAVATLQQRRFIGFVFTQDMESQWAESGVTKRYLKSCVWSISMLIRIASGAGFADRELKAQDVDNLWKIEKLRSGLMKTHTIGSALSCAKMLSFINGLTSKVYVVYSLRRGFCLITDITRHKRRPDIMAELEKMVSEWPLELIKCRKDEDKTLRREANGNLGTRTRMGT
ncbi:hypothetical protein Tco_0641213 [Tanacetum coccineum]